MYTPSHQSRVFRFVGVGVGVGGKVYGAGCVCRVVGSEVHIVGIGFFQVRALV